MEYGWHKPRSTVAKSHFAHFLHDVDPLHREELARPRRLRLSAGLGQHATNFRVRLQPGKTGAGAGEAAAATEHIHRRTGQTEDGARKGTESRGRRRPFQRMFVVHSGRAEGVRRRRERTHQTDRALQKAVRHEGRVPEREVPLPVGLDPLRKGAEKQPHRAGHQGVHRTNQGRQRAGRAPQQTGRDVQFRQTCVQRVFGTELRQKPVSSAQRGQTDRKQPHQQKRVVARSLPRKAEKVRTDRSRQGSAERRAGRQRTPRSRQSRARKSKGEKDRRRLGSVGTERRTVEGRRAQPQPQLRLLLNVQLLRSLFELIE